MKPACCSSPSKPEVATARSTRHAQHLRGLSLLGTMTGMDAQALRCTLDHRLQKKQSGLWRQDQIFWCRNLEIRVQMKSRQCSGPDQEQLRLVSLHAACPQMVSSTFSGAIP